jgi:hypothetical protein
MVESVTAPSVPRATREQHLARILFLLDRAGEDPGEHAPEGAYSLMHGQTRLQALDFWVRNPDYLADELLNEYEAGRMGDEAIETAKRIFATREPQIRRLPMTKWRFGAYERLDNTLSLLACSGLLVHRPHAGPESVREHLYWLMDEGHEFADALLAADPVFCWYADRAELVAALAASAGGAALKGRQYKQVEYATTASNTLISSIEPRVRSRLDEIEGTVAA